MEKSGGKVEKKSGADVYSEKKKSGADVYSGEKKVELMCPVAIQLTLNAKGFCTHSAKKVFALGTKSTSVFLVFFFMFFFHILSISTVVF
jgi:hypothetical protein